MEENINELFTDNPVAYLKNTRGGRRVPHRSNHGRSGHNGGEQYHRSLHVLDGWLLRVPSGLPTTFKTDICLFPDGSHGNYREK